MAFMNQDHVAEVVRVLRAASPLVEAIILYGSRARGDAGPRSDIDVAVSCPRASEREWLDICATVEKVPTLLGIDVIRLDKAPDSLRERVLREGRILYERGSDPDLHQESR